MIRTLFLLSPKITYKAFKMLQKKLVHDSGPVPQHIDKEMWELLKKMRLLCWFADDMPNDMGVGLELPKRYKNWEIKQLS